MNHKLKGDNCGRRSSVCESCGSDAIHFDVSNDRHFQFNLGYGSPDGSVWIVLVALTMVSESSVSANEVYIGHMIPGACSRTKHPSAGTVTRVVAVIHIIATVQLIHAVGRSVGFKGTTGVFHGVYLSSVLLQL